MSFTGQTENSQISIFDIQVELCIQNSDRRHSNGLTLKDQDQIVYDK